MSDAKLFRLTNGEAKEIHGSAVASEKSLQRLIEGNLTELLGVTFLESEYTTGPSMAAGSIPWVSMIGCSSGC